MPPAHPAGRRRNRSLFDRRALVLAPLIAFALRLRLVEQLLSLRRCQHCAYVGLQPAMQQGVLGCNGAFFYRQRVQFRIVFTVEVEFVESLAIRVGTFPQGVHLRPCRKYDVVNLLLLRLIQIQLPREVPDHSAGIAAFMHSRPAMCTVLTVVFAAVMSVSGNSRTTRNREKCNR